MTNFAGLIKECIPEKDQLCIFWLGGVSYIIKNQHLTIGLDLYLTDSCRTEKEDFKRLIPEFIDPRDLELDYLIATHEHGDHFDVGCLNELVNEQTKTKLVGPTTVMGIAGDLGVLSDQLIKLDRNENIALDHVSLRAVFADHGEYSPDATGVIIELDNKKIYFTGDTCYRPDLPDLIDMGGQVDLLIVPINGKFGNPNAKDAAYITAWVKPKTVIPCHYWMFKEHGGDPGEFVEWCKTIAWEAEIIVPAIGEKIAI